MERALTLLVRQWRTFTDARTPTSCQHTYTHTHDSFVLFPNSSFFFFLNNCVDFEFMSVYFLIVILNSLSPLSLSLKQLHKHTKKKKHTHTQRAHFLIVPLNCRIHTNKYSTAMKEPYLFETLDSPAPLKSEHAWHECYGNLDRG